MKKAPKSASKALRPFGRSITGEDRWRLIWSDDKLSIADGELTREYLHLPERWILEKWCENTLGPDEWEKTKDPETGIYILGPYTHGSYELAYAFPQGIDLVPSVVELIPTLIKAGVERYTISQRRIACRERLEKAEEAWKKRNGDIWDDAQAAFKGQAFSGAHGHRIRGPEDIQIVLTDKDVQPIIRGKKGFLQV